MHKTTKYDLIHRLMFHFGLGQRYNIGPRLSLVPYLNYMKAFILESFELDLNQRDTGFLMIVILHVSKEIATIFLRSFNKKYFKVILYSKSMQNQSVLVL